MFFHVYLPCDLKQATLSKQNSATINHYGGEIEIDGTGIRLKIPAGALPEGKSVTITLALHCHGDHPNDIRAGTACLVGPTISCEPDGLQFLKHVKLIVTHAIAPVHLKDLTILTKQSFCK